MSNFTIQLNATQAAALLEIVGQVLSKGVDKEPTAEKKVKIEAPKAAPKERASLRSRMVVKGAANKVASKTTRKRKTPTPTDKVLHEISPEVVAPAA